MSDYHPVVEAIKLVLDTAKISYQSFEHEPVRTSEEAAQVRPEYSLAQGAKSLLVRVKKEGKRYFIQVVVPGDKKFDPKKLGKVIGTKDIRFAYEDEVKEVTGGVVPGGVPPFGNIFGLTVYVEQTLLDNDEIIFNAGDRRYSIAMKSADYLNVVKPEVVEVV
jgi:Ala-tRNA(Pro) deacylase